VREVLVDDEERQATVIVPDDQLSLAIGRDGQNARLAARLTGWRVDIKSESEFAQEDEEIEYEGEEQADGRCMAVLSNGRRCPNAAIDGSTYCGLPQHQALSRFETNQIAVLAPLSEAEVEILADSGADEGQVTEIVDRATAAYQEAVAEEEAAEVEEAPAEEEAAEVEEAPAEEEAEQEPAGEAAEVEPEAEDSPAAPASEAEEAAADGEAESPSEEEPQSDSSATSEGGETEEEAEVPAADEEASETEEPASEPELDAEEEPVAAEEAEQA
jgi:N utilization substance protein A